MNQEYKQPQPRIWTDEMLYNPYSLNQIFHAYHQAQWDRLKGLSQEELNKLCRQAEKEIQAANNSIRKIEYRDPFN